MGFSFNLFRMSSLEDKIYKGSHRCIHVSGFFNSPLMFFYYCILAHRGACGFLVPQPGIEPVSSPHPFLCMLLSQPFSSERLGWWWHGCVQGLGAQVYSRPSLAWGVRVQGLVRQDDLGCFSLPAVCSWAVHPSASLLPSDKGCLGAGWHIRLCL